MKFKQAGLVLFMTVLAVSAGYIEPSDVFVPPTVAGSGNGTLDLRMFTFSGGEIKNSGKGFDYDNANNSLPQGGGEDVLFFNESYLTTVGDLRDYYRLNFDHLTGAQGEIELVLSMDINETGAAAQAVNRMSTLELILNPVEVGGLLISSYASDIEGGGKRPAAGDQAFIDQNYDGGMVLHELNPSAGVYSLPLAEQGAGHADYAIFTGFDPFDARYQDSDHLLFNLSMDTLNNGAEEIFLSGEYASTDYVPDFSDSIPEPAVASFVILFGLASLAIKRIFAK